MQMLKSAGCYFGIVFGAGFAFGVLRGIWLEPAIGTRMAQLLEMPLMLGILTMTARWIVRRFPARPPALLVTGVMALCMMLLAEISVGVGLRGLSVRQSLVNPDPVAGTFYGLSLVWFALAPLVWGRIAAKKEK